jgi:hypothetical protein
MHRDFTGAEKADSWILLAQLLQAVQKIGCRIPVLPIVAAVIDDNMKPKSRGRLSCNPAKIVTGQ